MKNFQSINSFSERLGNALDYAQNRVSPLINTFCVHVLSAALFCLSVINEGVKIAGERKRQKIKATFIIKEGDCCCCWYERELGKEKVLPSFWHNNNARRLLPSCGTHARTDKYIYVGRE